MQAFDNLHRDGLYDPKFERDNCGWGLITQMDGVASHGLVETALTALARLTHRGAIAADGLSGDGCGLLISKPDVFLRKVAKAADITLSANYAAGIVFLNPNHDADQRANFEAQIVDQGLEVAGWRTLDINTDVIGEQAKAQLPSFVQVFVNAPASLDADEFRRRLFVARRRHELGENAAYICSLSPDVLLYKGLVMPANLPKFYADLADPDCAASIAVFHQRFSTNTLPQWRLAQPFRMLAHNGEINTIQGNRNWARARGRSLKSTALPELSELHPIVTLDGSDSMSLDNMLEAMVLGGVDLFQAMRILVPPAWQNVDQMDPDLRAFLEFNSMHMEPWDGPAGIVFTDGRYACCTMDRNGLRPARYVVTNDRTITLASEVGVWDYDEAAVVKKGRLKPGQMLGIDTETGALMMPSQVDDRLKRMHPYAKWLQKHSRRLHSRLRDVKVEGSLEGEQYQKFEKLFDVTFEERDQVIRPCCEGGQEPVGSMGDDTPFPVMSHQIRSIYDNFRQQFAQVTNPPIDPLREAIVMSLETCLGAEANLFEATENSAKRLKIRSPILSREKFATLMAMGDEAEYKHQRFDLYFDPNSTDYKTALSELVDRAVEASKSGARLLVLSDRNYQSGMLPIHAALAVGALQNRLIDSGQRVHTNIIVETATSRDSHHMCVLLGYGATCIYPYLAYDIIADLHRNGDVEGELEQLEQNYRKGINKGILKILSKMGISTIASYRSAQLFEIVGLHSDVVEMCFKGTTSRVSGATFEHLQADAEGLAKRAEDPTRKTNQGGLLKYIHDGEYHAYNPDVVQTLQAAVRSGEWSDYEKYRDQVDNRPAAMLRDLLQLTSNNAPISIDEVEPVSEIVKRFDSAGMSLGALSPEAHETLAEAMNRLGARSNSGEGGEDAARYGTLKMSKIKQIASGRFGVTPHYLVNAEVLQIKVAQGAKPGEGGQLPGHKVDTLIARLRHSVPGVSLISPPPHHDIYSIEDLAQLIFDLKQVNPEALVSVKLVSEPGVGTIAAGVAKAYADLITISGYDGGTGASPLTSVKYAGSPWELGMSETHQMLRANGLREKVRVQADGGLKTGLDVIKAAILGAESFGFGTGPMIAMGCKFLRICHLNNCATGVATQNKILRMRHFNGDVEKVMNYMTMIAEDVRQHMASIGVRSLEDLIGRTQYLKPIEGFTDKQRALDLSAILSDGGMGEDRPRFCQVPRNEPYDKGELAEEMLSVCKSAIDNKSGGRFEFNIKNINRSIGARLSGEISRVHGANGLADAPIDVVLRGTAGQSFGVWNAHGLNLHLYGDANDYVGKGMNGGKIVIRPAENSTIDTRRSVIVGNTCLYGATGGQIFAAGLAGERFGVRNSGAVAVVEGLGDHGCEYMTGGCVVSLGETGVNFGAGMTGGLAFVLDMNRNFVDCYNHELIDIHRVTAESMEPYRLYLQELVAQYAQETGSEWGQEVSDNFYRYAAQFWLVKPKALELPQLFSTLRAAA